MIKKFLNRKVVFNVEMNELIIAMISFALCLNFILQFLINPVFTDMIHEIMRLVIVVTLAVAYLLTSLSFLLEKDEKQQKKYLLQMFLLALVPYGFYAFVLVQADPSPFYPQ